MPTKHFFTSYRANKFYLHPLSNSPSAVSLNIPNNRRIAWKKLPRLSIQQRFKLYKQLSKSRLTFLVVLTSMAGYALCPDSPAIGYKEELTTLLSTAGGVALCSASANALNQMLEVPLDSQMARTRVRPLCTRLMSPIHAVVFAGVTGLAGVGLLATGVNAPSAALGAANIALYSGIYTPLKRVHIINTWVGSIVGAIPPLIGWTASSGQLIPDSLDWKDIGAISALPYVLYTWQFPHFNSLAHLLRPQYASSGYSMLSVINPLKNSIVALRHAFIMLPLTAVLFPWSGLTTWNFAFTSTAINAPFAYLSWAFYREIKKNNPGDVAARRLFHASLIHLPLTLVLAMYHKRNSNHIDNYMNNSITTIDN